MATKYQLKNGLNVLLVESHKSPVVAVQMWVKTGSADEKKGVEGISHFIEHLVFKGSQKYGVGDMASAIEGAGGVLNAYTTFDQTVFYVTLSKTFVDTGLDVISEMMGRPAFDATEIDNEREVVIEEIKRSLDNPHQQASRMLFANMYRKHPYGIPVIGYDDNIRRVSREEILKYYQQRYLPQNMNLVVVGDFKSPEMKKKIEKFFGGFTRHKLAKVKRATEKAGSEPKLVVRKAPFAESYLYLSWPATPADHKDATVLALGTMILGQGESSRLVRRVRNEQQLVNSIGAGTFTPKEPGFLAISSTLAFEKLPEVLQAIEAEVREFLKNGPTSEELEKAVRQFESERFYSMETVDGLAGLYGHFEFLHDDYRYFDKILAQVHRTKPADVVKVMRQYLAPEKMRISYLTNDEEKRAEKTLANWAKSFHKSGKIKTKIQIRAKKPVKARAFKLKASKGVSDKHAQMFKLDSGATLVYKAMPEATVVSARYGFLGGTRIEDPATPGVNELAGRIWGTATRNLAEAELNGQIEKMASGLSAFAGRNSVGLSITSLVPNFMPTLDLMNDVLLNFEFQPEIVQREKQQMLEHFKTRNDKPAQKCMLNLATQIFAGHPYGRDAYASEDQINAIESRASERHLTHHLHPENLVVAVAGQVDLKALRRTLEKTTAELLKRFEKAAPKAERPWTRQLEMPALKEPRRSYSRLDKAQTHIALAHRGLKIQDNDRFVLEVLQSILSGQGGRLFVELRDKASLAYTVAPLRMDGLEPGYFGAYIGCSPEKADKAVEMMRTEFRKLVEDRVPDDEIARAKRYLLGRHDIALQKASHVADLMLFDQLYGLPFDEYERFSENLEAVSGARIQQLAHKIFAQPFVLSVVGKDDVSVELVLK